MERRRSGIYRTLQFDPNECPPKLSDLLGLYADDPIDVAAGWE
ncbi:MAG: hypothetical protein ABL889_20045 [Terricaulis sp.]